MYNFDLLTRYPVYTNCKDSNGNMLAKCDSDAICGKKAVSYEIDWSSSLSLWNWMEQMDMICWPSY